MRILPGVFLLLCNVLLAQEPTKPAASPASEPQSPTATRCAQSASPAQIQKLMDLAGSKKVLESVMEARIRIIIEEFQRLRPDVPLKVWNAAFSRLQSPQFVQGLLAEAVPIYQRHFCADEVEQIVAFYETPAGQKLSVEMPAIEKEAVAAGQNYAERQAPQLRQDLQQALAKQGKSGTAAKAASPAPPAVFILSSGEKLESSHYLVSSDSVQVEQGGTQRTIPLSALNVDATVAANRARGIDLKIPAKGQIMLGF